VYTPISNKPPVGKHFTFTTSTLQHLPLQHLLFGGFAITFFSFLQCRASSLATTKSTRTGPSEVDAENVQPITKDQLKDSDKAELKAHIKHYEDLCLASYGQTKSGVFKKSPLPMPKQVTFSADPEGLQDMITKAMHQTMIDQSKVFANTIQNAIIDAFKKGAEGGYLGPTYFQLKQTPLVF
jgi:hypothetical protein